MRAFYDKRLAAEVDGAVLGDEWKGYVLKIAGGNDKQGFCMTQGILRHDRTRILMKKGFPGYRQRRAGERKRKSARGCIVDNALSVLNLVVVKKVRRCGARLLLCMGIGAHVYVCVCGHVCTYQVGCSVCILGGNVCDLCGGDSCAV